jgi:hypothetical protein
MPQDGMFADGHHRLGAEFGFLLDACAQPAAQDENRNVNCVHAVILVKPPR